jgi:hypothetical protein
LKTVATSHSVTAAAFVVARRVNAEAPVRVTLVCDKARLAWLVVVPETGEPAEAVHEAMRAVEADNPGRAVEPSSSGS